MRQVVILDDVIGVVGLRDHVIDRLRRHRLNPLEQRLDRGDELGILRTKRVQCMHAGKVRHRPRKLGIEFDCLLEQLPVFVGMKPAAVRVTYVDCLVKRAIGGHVTGGDRDGLLGLGQRDVQRIGNGTRDIVLHVEDALSRELAVVGLGPQVLVGLRIDELRVDPDPVARALHAAFQQCVGAEFLTNLPHVALHVLVLHDRGARDDEHRRQLGEFREQIVVHTRGKELGILVRRNGAERQDGQHGPTRGAFTPCRLGTRFFPGRLGNSLVTRRIEHELVDREVADGDDQRDDDETIEPPGRCL